MLHLYSLLTCVMEHPKRPQVTSVIRFAWVRMQQTVNQQIDYLALLGILFG